ncbi:hypothetical protein [Tuwongella immobilis]|nr:hypothetical protein [Tuwongella immobilis]
MDRINRSHDRHLSSFMVRLPEIYRTQLRILATRHQKSMTEEVRLAVEAHLAREQLWPPPKRSSGESSPDESSGEESPVDDPPAEGASAAE